MALSPGARLGPYEIIAPIGAGGMGEVYRAKDSQLNRDVAIKVIPESFAADADRVARFTREAQVLASLNHSNIAAIYGIERNALVMELVDGDDLSVIIARGPLALPDALAIARQIADALEAAHEQGIVHRDLKPQNIKVRADGTVKVLDFGLAKATDPSSTSSANLANSPTMTSPAMTGMGMILGTAAYMSPEQAKGRVVDKRADIWAFGAVLYEMLTGKRAFHGDDVSDLLVAVLSKDVDLAALPASVPARLRAMVRDCLVRDPKQRLRDIGDARRTLDQISAGAAGEPVAAVAASSRTRERVVWAVLLVGVIAFFGWRGWRTAAVAPAGVSRFELSFPPGSVVAMPAISPDGTSIVYVAPAPSGAPMLYLRGIDQFDAKPLPGTEEGLQPFFSPDGKAVGFAAGGFLKTTSFGAGGVTPVCPMPDGRFRGASWGPDNTIVFAMFPGGDTLWRVPATGGTPEPLGASHAPRQVIAPQFLPDGRHIIYSVLDRNRQELEVYGLDDRAAHAVLPDAYRGQVLPGGHLAFVRRDGLMVVPFDANMLSVSGAPVRVADVNANFNTGSADYGFSATGTLVYEPPPLMPDRDLVWINRQGGVTPTGWSASQYGGIALSSDARRVAVTTMTGALTGTLSIGDLARGTLTPLAGGTMPAWSPDKRHVVYARDGHIFTADADVGPDSERMLTASTFDSVLSLDWSPDGAAIAFNAAFQQTGHDVMTLPAPAPDGTGAKDEASALIRTPTLDVDPRYSPNGRWLAYVSGDQVFVRSTGPDAARMQISTAGGILPRWAANSAELFYVNAGQLWAVPMEGSASGLRPGSAHALFRVPPGPWQWFTPWYDVAPDGRFLFIKPPANSAPVSSLRVVVNWPAELKK